MNKPKRPTLTRAEAQLAYDGISFLLGFDRDLV